MGGLLRRVSEFEEKVCLPHSIGKIFFHTTGSIASHADVLWTSLRIRSARSVWEATGNIAESDTITSEPAIIISVKPREIIASGTRHYLHWSRYSRFGVTAWLLII